MINKVAKDIFIPLNVGGGIKSLSDIELIFKSWSRQGINKIRHSTIPNSYLMLQINLAHQQSLYLFSL